MPVLPNPRHESFAQARAKGARLDDAYEDAGFAPGNGHASRLALKTEIAERIAELRAADEELSGANVPAVIMALLRIAKSDGVLTKAGGLKEARLALLDAARLCADVERDRAYERSDAFDD